MLLCSGYSINLVGACSVDCCLEAVKFFSLTQELHVFFFASPKCWRYFMNSLEQGQKPSVLKSLSVTRWSRHDDSCTVGSFNRIQNCLCSMMNDENETCDTRIEAQSLLKKLSKLETALMVTPWNDILERFDKTGVVLQRYD